MKIWWFFCSFLLAGCASNPGPGEGLQPGILEKMRPHVPDFFNLNQFAQILSSQGTGHASLYVNQALSMAPRNACLHLINGFLYEEMTRQGDCTKKPLAAVAYRTAYNIDPSFWLSCYLYGLHQLREKAYPEAQDYLSSAFILMPQNPDILYALTYASYFAQDLSVALSAVSKLVTLAPQRADIQKAAAIIFAATGLFSRAEEWLKKYQKSVGVSSYESCRLQQRVQEWKETHQNAKRSYSKDWQKSVKLPEKEDPSIIIDCYIIGCMEDASSLRGNNFLNLLSLNKTSLSTAWQRILDRKATYKPVEGSWKKTLDFDGEVSMSSASYSMNIANSKGRSIDFCYCPTVNTVLKKTVTFEDTHKYTGAVAGSTGGGVSDIFAGTSISVTPLSLTASGEVIMEVTLQHSAFFNPPTLTAGISQQVLGSSDGKIVSTIKAVLGQTTVLAGYTENSKTYQKEEVPFLGSIPLVQYFFAQQTLGELKTNLLYLITPRLAGKPKKEKSLVQRSRVHNKLKKCGFMSLGEKTNLFYILQFLDNTPFYADFRSGDLIEINQGFSCSPISDKLSQLAGFLYY